MDPDFRVSRPGTESIASGEMPPRDRIQFGYRRDRSAIVLPRAMFRGRVWLIGAFGLSFVVFPSVAGAHLLAGLLFKTIGLAIMAFGFFAMLFRQVIVDDGEQLVVEIELFGRPVHSEAVLKCDIEQIAIRTVRDRSKDKDDSVPRNDDGGKHRAVYLDASANRTCCLGACLAAEELDWLHQTVADWAGR